MIPASTRVLTQESRSRISSKQACGPPNWIRSFGKRNLGYCTQSSIFSKNETAAGVALLHEQGRVSWRSLDPQQRMEAIAKQYAANPTSTIIVSPDNASRMAINQAVRQELQAAGIVSSDRTFLPGADAAIGHDGR